MDKELRDLLNLAFVEGIMFEATTDKKHSFNAVIERLEKEKELIHLFGVSFYCYSCETKLSKKDNSTLVCKTCAENSNHK